MTLESTGDVTNIDEDTKLSLSSLSELTGFPEDFIKKELLLEGETLSMKELRESVLTYLEATLGA